MNRETMASSDSMKSSESVMTNEGLAKRKSNTPDETTLLSLHLKWFSGLH
jgi:hypothetical protein